MEGKFTWQLSLVFVTFSIAAFAKCVLHQMTGNFVLFFFYFHHGVALQLVIYSVK